MAGKKQRSGRRAECIKLTEDERAALSRYAQGAQRRGDRRVLSTKAGGGVSAISQYSPTPRRYAPRGQHPVQRSSHIATPARLCAALRTVIKSKATLDWLRLGNFCASRIRWSAGG